MALETSFAAIHGNMERSRALVAVATSEEAEYQLFFTSRESIEETVAPIRQRILQRWIPSPAFEDVAAIPRPPREAATIRFESGGSIDVPSDWVVLEIDAEPEVHPADFLAADATLDLQQLANVRCFAPEEGGADVVHLSRAGLRLPGGDLAWIDRQLFSAIVSEMISTYRSSIGEPQRRIPPSLLSDDFVELTLGEIAPGLFADLCFWRSGDECLIGFGTSQVEHRSQWNLRDLRKAYTTRRLQNARDQSERVAQAARFGRGFGTALVPFLLFGAPGIIGALLGRRWALVGLVVPFLCCGSMLSYGHGSTTAWDLAREANKVPTERAVLATAGLSFALETLGESVPLITRSTMPELAWRVANGESRAMLVMCSVLGLGAGIAIGIPMLLCFIVLRRRIRHGIMAAALGIGWWIVAVTALIALESVNELHRACALGAALMTMLLVPSRKPSADRGAVPPPIPADHVASAP